MKILDRQFQIGKAIYLDDNFIEDDVKLLSYLFQARNFSLALFKTILV